MKYMKPMKSMKLTKKISLVLLCSSSVFSATLLDLKLPKFPEHIEQCIGGYLYRAFVNERNQVIPNSIHQVFVKSALHGKMFPQTCKNGLDDEKTSEK